MNVFVINCTEPVDLVAEFLSCSRWRALDSTIDWIYETIKRDLRVLEFPSVTPHEAFYRAIGHRQPPPREEFAPIERVLNGWYLPTVRPILRSGDWGYVEMYHRSRIVAMSFCEPRS